MISSADVYDMLRDGGSQITLRRPGSPNVDVCCLAMVSGYRPQELVGNVIQGDRKVIISNVEIDDMAWPGPPRHGDQVIIDGTTTAVQGCDSRRIGLDYVKHEIQVRG